MELQKPKAEDAKRPKATEGAKAKEAVIAEDKEEDSKVSSTEHYGAHLLLVEFRGLINHLIRSQSSQKKT